MSQLGEIKSSQNFRRWKQRLRLALRPLWARLVLFLDFHFISGKGGGSCDESTDGDNSEEPKDVESPANTVTKEKTCSCQPSNPPVVTNDYFSLELDQVCTSYLEPQKRQIDETYKTSLWLDHQLNTGLRSSQLYSEGKNMRKGSFFQCCRF